LRIGDPDIGQNQIRIESLPTGLDAPDADRQPECLADLALDLGPIILDVRQDQIAQRQNQQHESKIEQQQATQRKAPDQTHRRVRNHRHQIVQAMVERRAQFLVGASDWASAARLLPTVGERH
jgi:hypothetical protein